MFLSFLLHSSGHTGFFFFVARKEVILDVSAEETEHIQSGPKVGIQYIVYNYGNTYCIPTFGPLCIHVT